MRGLKLPSVTDLDSARAFLGDRQSARLGHNTTIRHDLGGDVIVTYHHTDIVTYVNHGPTILRADGWVTSTTADRLHQLTPGNVRVGHKGDDFLVTVDGITHSWDGYGRFQIAN